MDSSHRNLRYDPSGTGWPSPSGSSRNPSAVDAPTLVLDRLQDTTDLHPCVDYVLAIPLDEALEEDLRDENILMPR